MTAGPHVHPSGEAAAGSQALQLLLEGLVLCAQPGGNWEKRWVCTQRWLVLPALTVMKEKVTSVVVTALQFMHQRKV